MADNDHYNTLKKRIVAYASKLFEKRGVHDVTMDEISSTLKISKRTLYEIFNDKETLLIECMKLHKEKQHFKTHQIIESSSNVLEVILRIYENSIKDLHQVNLKFFQDIHQYPKAAALIEEHREHDFNSSVSFFHKGVDQGIFRNDINFTIFVAILHEQMNSLFDVNDWRRFSFFDVYEFIMFTFLRGISTPAGLEIIDKFIMDYREKKSNHDDKKKDSNHI